MKESIERWVVDGNLGGYATQFLNQPFRGQDPENLTKNSIISITVTQLTLRHKKVPKHYQKE